MRKLETGKIIRMPHAVCRKPEKTERQRDEIP